MKFIYAAFFFNILFLTSCKTTKPITETTTEQKEQKTQEPTIIGRWKLNKLSGGIVGREQDPPIGQVIVIEFTPTELITIINGKITTKTSYTLGKGKSIHKTELVPMIFTNGNTTMGKSYHLDKDKLGISEEMFDGFYYNYIKIGKNDDGLLRE